MASNILSIGQSALNAAQVGIATAGHNIANASTAGYSRQLVVQAAAPGQDFGYGFVGRGTDIAQVRRVYNEVLGGQVREAQSAKTGLETYYTQIRQIDNLLSNPDAGLSPALQEFFSSIQQVSANPTSTAARQLLITAAESLESRFKGLDTRMQQIRTGLDPQIAGSIDTINTSARQLAELNDAIGKALARSNNAPPNDLYDQRDQLLAELSKEIRTSVVKQDGGQFNVFVGNGLPLVVGNQTFELTTTASSTDPNRIEPAYLTSGGAVALSAESVAGGKLGGLLEFRDQTLDAAQNALGRVAVALARSFNEQHTLGVDLKGNRGGNLFREAGPVASAATGNTGSGIIAASIVDVKALVTSDYQVRYDGTNFAITRLSDNSTQSFATLPQTIDGVQIDLASGSPNAGDEFRIQPTIRGAADFDVILTDTNAVAAGAPVRSGSAATNTGGARITGGTVDASYYAAPLATPLTLTFDSSASTLSGFPGGSAVTVESGGVVTTYPPGASVGYITGATIRFDGMELSITGTPATGDTFTLAPNASGSGDNRNALALGLLQTTGTMSGGADTYQGAYGQLVSLVGGKTHELDVTSAAQTALLTDTVRNLQTESGVNLDEEAANLLRYQQAYQAAGRIMQVASTLFDTLLNLGR